MNIYQIIGFSLAIGVLIGGLKLSSDNLSIFLDFPSVFIVLGGTFAATSISFQLNRLVTLFKVFFIRVIKGQRFQYKDTIKEMMRIAEAYRRGESLDNFIGRTHDPFLKDALELIVENILDTEHLLEVIENRAENMMITQSEETRKIKSISKYPPAFGMMGTTIGMIVLLANLGGEDAIKMIGPAMGVCLITTMYGVAIANLIIIPIAENLNDNTREQYLKNRIIVEGVKLLLKKTNPIVVAIELNSFLQPKDRLDRKEIVG